MNIFGDFSESVSVMISSAWFFTKSGGWIIYVLLFFYLLRDVYQDKIKGDFVAAQKQVFLHVKVEKENLQSLLAVEHLFANLHALHGNFTFAERWIEGKVNLWFSFEIVSIGGKISFLVRTPEKSMGLVQTAFYSHFPNAEITIVQDYMEHLKHWDPKESTWDMWGTEFKMLKDKAYPIRTWRDFEHTTAEEPILDPLAPMYEALSRAEPHELMAVQYITRPIADGDWVPKSQKLIKKLKEEEKDAPGFVDTYIPVLKAGSHKTIFEVMAGGKTVKTDDGKQPKIMRMSEGEKEILLGIEEKMKKPAWETKIRFLYIAPKDKFDGAKKATMIGAYRGLTTSPSNGLKPDVSGTWTNYNYSLFKAIEKPYTEYKTNYKKEEFLKGYVKRSGWIGAKYMLFNIEELATLIHLPLAAVKTGAVERIDVKKGQPPANLPIAQ